MAGVRKQKSAHRPIMESGFPVIAITDAPCLFAAFTDAATTSVVPEKEKASTTSSFVIVIVERRLIWLSCKKKALLFMVHFGVVLVVNCAIGAITPPFGVVIYLVAPMLKMRVDDFIKELIPFIAVLIGILLIMVFSPGLCTFMRRSLGQDRGKRITRQRDYREIRYDESIHLLPSCPR